ncbi:MAG: DUF6174 domain-containing protein [Kofleriaceae bacterium]
MRLPLAFALALTACSGSGSSTPAETELEAARTKFEQSSSSGSYTFHSRRSCECTTEATREMFITVENGAITSAIYVDNEMPVPQNLRDSLFTIESAFEEIQTAIDENAHMIYVEYDASLGYPASIAIDYSAQIADEELSLIISNVEPLLQTCGVRPCG